MIRINHGLHLGDIYEDVNSYIDDNSSFISGMFQDLMFDEEIITYKHESDYSIKEKFDTLIEQNIWEVVEVENKRNGDDLKC